MNREFFDLHVETRLAPILHEGGGVILDTLATHPSPKAAAIRVHFSGKTAHRTPFRSLKLLPPCSPDLNPVEMAFAKLKTLIRKAAARPYDQVWQAVGSVGNVLKEEECSNFLKAAGYETN